MVVLDAPDMNSSGLTLLAEEVQSFVVLNDPNLINHFVMEAKMKFIAHPGAMKLGNPLEEVEKDYNKVDQLIVLYERPNSYLYRSNKKDIKRIIWGYEPKVTFYSPNYAQQPLPEHPDLRRTLYWNPQVILDNSGKGSAVFFNNSHDGTQLRISLQGITQDGRMVSYER